MKRDKENKNDESLFYKALEKNKNILGLDGCRKMWLKCEPRHEKGIKVTRDMLHVDKRPK